MKAARSRAAQTNPATGTARTGPDSTSTTPTTVAVTTTTSAVVTATVVRQRRGQELQGPAVATKTRNRIAGLSPDRPPMNPLWTQYVERRRAHRRNTQVRPLGIAEGLLDFPLLEHFRDVYHLGTCADSSERLA